METHDVEFIVNGKKQVLKFPLRLSIRPEQNPKCNACGSMCGIQDSDLVCLRIELDDKEEKVVGFDVHVCEKNPTEFFTVTEGSPSLTIKKKEVNKIE
jgi:hypothetical protein